MAALFLAMGVICGFLAGLSPRKIATTFTAGAKGIAGSALTVGFARGIILTLEDAMIIDTISNAVATAVNSLPASIQSIGFFLAQTLTSFVITSGSGIDVYKRQVVTDAHPVYIHCSRKTKNY